MQDSQEQLMQGTAAGAGTLLGTHIIGRRLVNSLNLRYGDLPITTLKKLIEESGVDVGVNSKPTAKVNYGYAPAWAAKPNDLKNVGAHGAILKSGPSVLWNTPAAAHELGHAMQRHTKGPIGNIISNARILGNPGLITSPLAAFYGMLRSDMSPEQRDRWLNGASILAGASAVPILADEALASRNALQLIRNSKIPDVANQLAAAKKLLPRAFGTYGATAVGAVALPQVMKYFKNKELEKHAMTQKELLFMAKQSNAIDTALDAASWVPGFVGAGAGAVKGVKNLAQGNILKGIGDLALGGAQLFGGGTLIKGIGKGLQYGSKLLGGSSLGAKAIGAAKGLGTAAMKTAPTLAGGVQRGAQALGSGAYKAMVPEATQLGRKIVGTGPGGWMANNTGKMTLGGMGAGMAGGMREAGEAATQAHDRGIVDSMQSLAESSRMTAPNPIFQQHMQPPGSYMMGPGSPMYG